MLETSLPSFPGRDCPSERTGLTVQRQFTMAFLFITLGARPMGKAKSAAGRKNHRLFLAISAKFDDWPMQNYPREKGLRTFATDLQ